MRAQLLRTQLVVWGAGLALLAGLARAGTPGARPLAAAGPAHDTTRDSLIVSDAVYQGWKWFHVYCFRCHGEDAIGGGLAPDLRISVGERGLVTREAFLQAAREGRLTKGMPAWNALLDSAQIEQIYAYVRARSGGSLAPGRPHRASDVGK